MLNSKIDETHNYSPAKMHFSFLFPPLMAMSGDGEDHSLDGDR